jgi:hypothetical protein
MATIHDIKLTPARLDRAKRELKKLLPDVQHSHRLEAFARGFGFGSYHAFQKYVQEQDERGELIRAKAADSSFNAYLAASGVALNSNTMLTDMLRKWPEARA